MLVTATSMLFLFNWVTDAVPGAHVMPKVTRCNFMEIDWLSMDCSEMVYLLAEQTGLCEQAVCKLLEENRGSELLRLQEIYFAPARVESYQTTPLTVSEWLVEEAGVIGKGMPMVDIQNGDILITKNSRFLGWRNGHVGLVIDADEGLVLEALMLGSPSQICRLSKWEKYPSFQVLRLKDEYSREQTLERTEQSVWIQEAGVQSSEGEELNEYLPDAVAGYASENLVGSPYHLFADVLKSPKADELAIPTGTHCAHLVWYAYAQFGIDLDSDGGIIVTPEDIRNSSYLEVIQSYGY